ncbi:synaptotagmin-9-like [Lampetra planeri]
MPTDSEPDLCDKALTIVAELCFKGVVLPERCQDFAPVLPEDLFRYRQEGADVSVSLLAVVVTLCGVALLGVSLFVSWKLCWVPCRDREREARAAAAGAARSAPYLPQQLLGAAPALDVNGLEYEKAPHIHASGRDSNPVGQQQQLLPLQPLQQQPQPLPPPQQQQPTPQCPQPQQRAVQRQGTDQSNSSRPSSIRTLLNRSSRSGSEKTAAGGASDGAAVPQTNTLGRIKPELYKARPSVPSVGSSGDMKAPPCGRINFQVRYDYEGEQLVVKINKAVDLPAKDFSGTSDPYVKIYLLPERKRKYQTKVHRKTLNPVFDETFQFGVPYSELASRRLHFSVYDFDRFSRHDIIGTVLVDNLLEATDHSRETSIWRDIEFSSTEKVDLGELMFSLCYLPTAGRLTLTVIKARNLKAMDITGASDPYVKVSLMCSGRRLKKRKTSTKRNTLNPVYNEEIVFDIPPENMDQVNLIIAVVDYDRVGHNEVIGVCWVGGEAEGMGRDHWNEMLAYPRKPIAHWHLLAEARALPPPPPPPPPTTSPPPPVSHWYHRPTVSFNGRGLLNPTSSSSTPRLGCLPRRSAGRAGTAVRAVTAAHRRRRRSFPAPLLPPSHQRFSAAKGNGAPRQGLTMRCPPSVVIIIVVVVTIAPASPSASVVVAAKRRVLLLPPAASPRSAKRNDADRRTCESPRPLRHTQQGGPRVIRAHSARLAHGNKRTPRSCPTERFVPDINRASSSAE